MFQHVPVTHQMGFFGQTLRLETGLLARQATASVVASCGETTVMANVVIGKESGQDYFPLQVMYEEKLYASGKIKGSRFIKREGRPTDNAILTGRMIDRSLRSLFDNSIRTEIQVIVTVLSLDEINTPDTLAVVAASAAMALCGVKSYAGPVSAVRVGVVGGKNLLKPQSDILNFKIASVTTTLDVPSIFTGEEELQQIKPTNLSSNDEDNEQPHNDLSLQNQPVIIANPSYAQMVSSPIDLVVSGDGKNIMMLEAGASEITENEMEEYLDFANQQLKILTDFQQEFIKKATEAGLLKSPDISTVASDVKYQNYWNIFANDLEEALFIEGGKDEKTAALNAFRLRHTNHVGLISTFVAIHRPVSVEELKQKFEVDLSALSFELDENIIRSQVALLISITDVSGLKSQLLNALDVITKKIVQSNILIKKRRLDGRALDEVRPIFSQIDVLPRTHASSLFQRGETQVMNILTLGTLREALLQDDMEDFEESTKRYMHHYNFPSYSVGETGRYGAPGRREIGHGSLAEKALLPVLPSEDEFPYTMRLVSECLGSNGSTSMASTCASTLSLMAGGVPIKKMVAGVAMGLVLDSSTGAFEVLTDIQGAEDHYGDMDFKVTGTADGITAIQLDNKVSGLTVAILKQALHAALAGRMHILGKMQEVITAPRKDISQYAPRVAQLQIPFEKIGDVIGANGKIIKKIIADTGVKIDIADDSGKTTIYSDSSESIEKARKIIEGIIKEYEPGEQVAGEVYRIEPFGAFVHLSDTGKDGMIHISKLSSQRVEKVEDVVSMGQKVTVEIVKVNERGQIDLRLMA